VGFPFAASGIDYWDICEWKEKIISSLQRHYPPQQSLTPFAEFCPFGSKTGYGHNSFKMHMTFLDNCCTTTLCFFREMQLTVFSFKLSGIFADGFLFFVKPF